MWFAATALAVPFAFDYEILSRATDIGDGYYQYDYLVFAVDQGPDFNYRELSYANDIFLAGEDAYLSVDWDSLEMWSNVGTTEAWLAQFEHGYINGPVPGGYYWGDKWNVPDGIGGLTPDGDGVSFVDPDKYDWAGFGDDLLGAADDPDDQYLAFSYRSTYLPAEGEWWAKDGLGYEDHGTKIVPGQPPISEPVPEPSSLVCLLALAAGVGWRARQKIRERS